MRESILIINKENNKAFRATEYAEGHNGKHYIEINQKLINPLGLEHTLSYRDTLLIVTNDLWVYQYAITLKEDNKVSYRFDRIA